MRRSPVRAALLAARRHCSGPAAVALAAVRFGDRAGPGRDSPRRDTSRRTRRACVCYLTSLAGGTLLTLWLSGVGYGT